MRSYQGIVAYHQSRPDEARELLRDSLRISDEDVRVVAKTCETLGSLSLFPGSHTEAEGFFRQAFDAYARVRERNGRCLMLEALANVAYTQGRYEEASRLFQEAAARSEELGDFQLAADVRHGLALVCLCERQPERAEELLQGCLRTYRRMGASSAQGRCLTMLGFAAWQRHDHAAASRWYAESVRCWRRTTDPRGLVECLLGLAMLSAARDARLAPRLAGAAQRELARHPGAAEPFKQEMRREMEASLPPERGVDPGSTPDGGCDALSLDAAIDAALACLERAEAPRAA